MDTTLSKMSDYDVLKHMDEITANAEIPSIIQSDFDEKWELVLLLKRKFPHINVLSVVSQAFIEDRLSIIDKLIEIEKQHGLSRVLNEGFLMALYYNLLSYARFFLNREADINHISQVVPFDSPGSSAWRIAIDADSMHLTERLVLWGADKSLPIHPDGLLPHEYAKGRSSRIEQYLGNIEYFRQRQVIEEMPDIPEDLIPEIGR